MGILENPAGGPGLRRQQAIEDLVVGTDHGLSRGISDLHKDLVILAEGLKGLPVKREVSLLFTGLVTHRPIQAQEAHLIPKLGGGRAFGAVISRNLTPDPETGLPSGLTLDEFILVMRTGVDLDNRLPHVPSAENDLLQVMPWPAIRKMTDQDLEAIYEYLRSIPSVP